MPPVPARAAVKQMLLRDGHQPECVIEFAIGQQAPASEVTLEPWNSSLRRRSKSSRKASDCASPAACTIFDLNPIKQNAESYGSNGFGLAQFNGSSGKCGFKRDWKLPSPCLYCSKRKNAQS